MPECSILPLRGRLADPSHGECTWLQIGWGIVIFVVNVFFLKIFVTITSRSERLREDLIEEKIGMINSALDEPSDGLPRASISVGAAYGNEADDMTRLFRNADRALHQRKQAGRKGCSFYRET